ncbi:unnamed protein product [Tetraodon nigroviridis]|nr:unnamed protein product [Tetraodon nigroviridis]
MAFLSSFSDFEKPSNSFEMTDRLDSVDSSAFPSTVELCKAVSASLGLDTASSPLSHVNHSCSGIGYSVFGPAAESGPELEPSREGAISTIGTDRNEDGFGEVRQDTVSCVELFGSGQMDSAQLSESRVPVISGLVHGESSLFTNPVGEVQRSELSTPKPYNAHFSNPRFYLESPAVWRAHGREAEPESSGGFHMLCKYCSYGQASNGAGRECRCAWYSSGEQGGKNGTQVAQEYGQVEMYQSAKSQGHGTCPIKTEPPRWVDWTDHRFR